MGAIALLLLALPLPMPEPAIVKPVQPRKFIESVGRRAALLGREDGTFEAWIMPVKVLRDFRLSVYFDGALEPLPLAELAERVTIGPGRVTITHAHAAFTIRQTWLAALDEPAAVVLLDIDTGRPLRLRAAFQLEMQPMWPASFGGQASAFDEKEHALVVSEGLRKHTAIIGSPKFVRASEQVGHQMPDRTVLMEMDLTPADRLAPIVIADSRAAYRKALADLPRLVAQSDDYYRAFAQRTLRVETPDATMNAAFEWAKYALDKGWQCDPGVGCGLVAGFGPSGAGQRPGFAWFFGGDALMNSWSIVDYGDLPRARALLEFLRQHQRGDGKMEHELTQSAALLDWSKYPYGYFHADTTPLYIYSAARYVRRSGDLEFLRASWPSIEKAYRFCLSALDSDGLMSNRKAGAAAVETGALSGRVEKDVYLQGVWLAALEGYAAMARAMALPAEAASAAERLAKARAALNAWFTAKGFLAFGRLTDGSMYEALSSWQGLALALGGLDERRAARAAAALNRPELSTDWGTRLFSTDSPFYDPLSYNDGSVWPFVTGFAILGEYRQHCAVAAWQHLHALASLTGFSGAAFIPEYLGGDRAQALPRAVPHQLFSSSAVVNPLVGGMLGLEGDALAGRLRFAPHLPPDWPRVRFAGYRAGGSRVSGEVERRPGSLRIALKIDGEPLDVVLAPALPAGSVPDLSGGGRLEMSGSDVHLVLEPGRVPSLERTIRLREGVALLPDLVTPAPGDRSRAVRLLDTQTEAGRIRFLMAGPAGSHATVRAWCGSEWQHPGARRLDGGMVELPLAFPPGEGFTTAVVEFSNR